jgi:predicted metal-binding membrane protein
VAARLLAGRSLVAGLAGLAFVALLTVDASPYGLYLDHAHQPPSAAGQAGAIALYLVGWLLMTTAMMMPTAAGIVRAFDRVTGARPDALRLRLSLVAGFLGVWLVVGYVFRGADVLVHLGVSSIGWLGERPSLVGAASFAVAGAYQFSALKHRCLTACRTPRSFILRGWGGGRPGVDALRIGVDYGRSCIGCCWALMLVMFGVGASSLAWMLALAAVMAGERFAPPRLQSRLGELTGSALLVLAVALAVQSG